MSEHTPGPWVNGTHGYGNVKGPGTSKKFRRVRSGEVEVARVWCGAADDEPRDSSPHDLMLIAAAPELLEALKLAAALLTCASESGALYGRHDIHWGHLRDGIRGVINKAEGRDER
jgi:hypothetical protein